MGLSNKENPHNNNNINNSHDCSCCDSRHAHDHGSCSCEHSHEEVDKSSFYFKAGVGGALLAAGIVLLKLAEGGSPIPSFTYLLCFIISYMIVGFSVVREAVEGVMQKDVFNENFLMTIASVGAFAVGEYSEGCMVMLLYTIGEYLQGLAVAKSKKSIRDMMELKPQQVTVIRNGAEVVADAQDIKVGEVIILRPGDKLELDGVITQGCTQMDMKALTGESIPVTMGAGDFVSSGSINLDGTVRVEAVKLYKDSAVAKIMEMLEASQEKKSRAELFIRKFARIYTPVVCLLALLIAVVAPLFFNGDWRDWAFRGLSALVVSCPCALVISIPLSFFGGIGACSKQGILVKGGNYLEMLAKADTGVFDKTGTITSGKFEYVKCECHNCHCTDNNHRELLKLIAACEKYSAHPLAKSICLAFGHYADECEVTDSKNYAGMGVSAVVDGTRYYVGSEKLMKKTGVAFEPTQSVGTAVYCASDTQYMGCIVFADIIKSDSKTAIKRLKQMGLNKTVMLTGDKEHIAGDIASRAGIDEYHSRLMPEEKVQIVKDLQQNGSVVLYTGDGINDAPVLSQADVGIAMGKAGSDIAIEASDVVIMSDSLSKIPTGRKIAKKTMRIARENVIISLAVKLIIILGTTAGLFDENAMWLAVFGDVGVCLIAIANSMRTLIVRRSDK